MVEIYKVERDFKFVFWNQFKIQCVLGNMIENDIMILMRLSERNCMKEKIKDIIVFYIIIIIHTRFRNQKLNKNLRVSTQGLSRPQMRSR